MKPPHSSNLLQFEKKYDFHSYILCKGILFYLFEIELLLFLSSTPYSCTEEFSQFHFVFVLVTDNMSFVNFDHVSRPSAFQIEESESLFSLCNIAVLLLLAHQLIIATYIHIHCYILLDMQGPDNAHHSGYRHLLVSIGVTFYRTQELYICLGPNILPNILLTFVAAIAYRSHDFSELLMIPMALS